MGNIKRPSEKAAHIIPLLENIKKNLDIPVALVSDDSTGIRSEFESVFPDIPRFLCHFHWLRNCGKGLKDYGFQTILGKLSRGLRANMGEDKVLIEALESYLNNNDCGITTENFPPTIIAYTLSLWILEAKHHALSRAKFPEVTQ